MQDSGQYQDSRTYRSFQLELYLGPMSCQSKECFDDEETAEVHGNNAGDDGHSRRGSGKDRVSSEPNVIRFVQHGDTTCYII